MSEGKTGTMTTGKFPPETVFLTLEYFVDREKKLKAELTALRAECDRLKEEKRELVEHLEVINEGWPKANNPTADLIAKHKEAL